MNTPTEEIIQKAISEAKAGNKETAKKILSQVVRHEPNNTRAWYLLSQVVEKKEQAVYCLEKVLKLQPDNQQAKQCLTQLADNEKETENQQQLIQTTRSSFELFPTKKTLDSPHVDYSTKKCLSCGEIVQNNAKICENCGNDLTKEATQSLARIKANLLQEQLVLEKNLTGWERYLQEQSDLAIEKGKTGSRYFWIFVGLILSPVIIGIIIIVLAAVDLSRMNTKRNDVEANKTKARRNIEITRNRILEIRNELNALSNYATYKPKPIIDKSIATPQRDFHEIPKIPSHKSKSNIILIVVLAIIMFSIMCYCWSIFISDTGNSNDSDISSSVSYDEKKAIKYIQDWKPKNNEGWTCEETFNNLVYFYKNNLGISDARVEWSATKQDDYNYFVYARLKGEIGWANYQWKLILPSMRIIALGNMNICPSD